MADLIDATIPAYDRATRRFHWTVAALIAFLWIMAQLNTYLPKGPLRLNIWSIHVLVGFVLAAIVALRIGWRLTRGRRLPPFEGGLRHRAAITLHRLLYLLMVAVVVLGVVNVFARGFPLFGLWHFPELAGDALQERINDWHELAANLIAGAAAIHTAAALYHHHVLKDDLLARMGLRRRPR